MTDRATGAVSLCVCMFVFVCVMVAQNTFLCELKVFIFFVQLRLLTLHQVWRLC